MIRRALVTLLLLFPGLARAQNTVGWSKDGRWLVVWQDIGAGTGTVQMKAVDLWSDAVETQSYDRNNCMTGDSSPESDEYVRICEREQKELSSAFEAKTKPFLDAHPTTDADPSFTGPTGAAFEVLESKGPVAPDGDVARIDPRGTYVFRVGVKGRPSHEQKAPASCDEVRPFWSKDGQWVLVLCKDPDADLIDAVVRVPAAAQVDLLDAGAGAGLAAVSGAAAKAGYPPAHQGKSRDPHEKTEIYVAKGFEAEAAQIASALGLPADSVKPLTWPTRYAITVVAAKR